VYTTVRQGRGSPPPTADTDRERKREETDPDARDYERAALPVRPPRRDQPARAKGCESEPQEQQAEQTLEHDQRISSEWCARDIPTLFHSRFVINNEHCGVKRAGRHGKKEERKGDIRDHLARGDRGD